MAHTDRQPKDDVFNDIVEAGVRTWNARCNWSEYHDDYRREKTDRLYDLVNYADNWYSVLSAMDERNQMIFWHYLRKEASAEFLKKMHKTGLYSHFVPREKE